MNIQSYQKPSILRRFPGLELSYEETVYKKVREASVFMAIPSGQKCFAWITSHGSRRVCFIVKLVNGKICGLDSYPACFDSSLALGTVLYGSIIKCKRDVRYFYPEDILQFKGKMIDRLHWATRLNYLHSFLKLTSPTAYTTDFLVFVAPSLSERQDDLLKGSTQSLVVPEFIQARLVTEDGFRNQPVKTIRRTMPKHAVLRVKAEIKSDTYSLYAMNDDRETFVGLACVPDYKTSKCLNGMFRNIWENMNLDNVEESEDEDEFEDVSEDKYVSLDKSYIMQCDYSHRFRQWIPRVVSSMKITNASDLK